MRAGITRHNNESEAGKGELALFTGYQWANGEGPARHGGRLPASRRCAWAAGIRSNTGGGRCTRFQWCRHWEKLEGQLAGLWGRINIQGQGRETFGEAISTTI